MEKLRTEIRQLQKKKEELESNISGCDNQALLQRFRESLAQIDADLKQREEDVDAFSMFS